MDIATITTLLLWIAALLMQFGLYLVGALVITVTGLGVLLAIRQVWRWVTPYERPEWGGVPTIRDRLENL